MKTLSKKLISAVLCAGMIIPGFPEIPHKSQLPTTSIVMTAEAANKCPEKLSGKSKSYISNVLNPSITICMNTNTQVTKMIKTLETTKFWTSGCKASAAICDIPNIALNSTALKVAGKIFTTLSNSGKKAGKAAKKMKSLHNSQPSKGIKITFKAVGDWVVQYQ